MFDEGVPECLADNLPGHEIRTVRSEGWKGAKNGNLLNQIEVSGFEAFLTNDKRMEFEQQLRRRPFAILILSATNWPVIRPHVNKIAEAIDTCRPGTVTKIDCGTFVPVSEAGALIRHQSAPAQPSATGEIAARKTTTM